MIAKETCISILTACYKQPNHILSETERMGFTELLGIETYVNHINYLYETGLISETGFSISIDNVVSFNDQAQITSKGIDYLEGENSLGHELNITTVKLHPQTIADLESIIRYSNLPPEEKEGLLKELAKHGAKDMVTKSVEYAMSNGGALLMLIQTWLKSQ